MQPPVGWTPLCLLWRLLLDNDGYWNVTLCRCFEDCQCTICDCRLIWTCCLSDSVYVHESIVTTLWLRQCKLIQITSLLGGYLFSLSHFLSGSACLQLRVINWWLKQPLGNILCTRHYLSACMHTWWVTCFNYITFGSYCYSQTQSGFCLAALEDKI